jgi:hypothetical protein
VKLCVRCHRPKDDHAEIDADAALMFGECPRYEPPAPLLMRMLTGVLDDR